jgi:glycosyltransferase involved in cell wall biosynthesis
MNELPLVSVLMTSFNREKYIAEAIESVLASSYRNLELIIVDDCSSDNTVSIAKKYAESDARITVYLNDRNLGDYHNRNQAAGYANGKYIKYLDSDDLIYPESLSVFVSGMEKFPDAAVGIMSNVNQEDFPYPFQLQPRDAYHHHFFIRGIFDTGPSGLIFRTDRFKESGGFSGKRYVGDTEMNLALAARWPLVKLASSLIFWRKHEEQEIVSGMNSTGYLELQLPVIVNALTSAGCPLSEKEKSGVLDYYKKISTREVLKLAVLKKQPAMAVKLFKKLSLSGKDLVNAVFFMKKELK